MDNIKKGEWCEFQVQKGWANLTVDHIVKELWQVPRGLLHHWRMEKGIKVNGENVPWYYELNEGDKIQVHMFPREDYGVTPTYLDIQILYEDDHVLVVNKPAGVDTHPATKVQTDTLANAVAYHLLTDGIETKVRHIHRLDKDTTGAVLFAKHALAGAIMDRLLEQRIIKRTYLALVHGKLKKKKDTIDLPIGRDRHHPTRRRVSPKGKQAITKYEVLDYKSSSKVALLKLQLQTGRTHQIRVHLSHIGHPLIGDSLYSEKKESVTRQALHAAKITFPHPISNEEIDCIAPFLDDEPLFEYDINTLFKR